MTSSNRIPSAVQASASPTNPLRRRRDARPSPSNGCVVPAKVSALDMDLVRADLERAHAEQQANAGNADASDRE
jgi:hypothetical protein